MITNDDLLLELKRIAYFLGHAPSYEEVRKHGKYGPATYQRRFGTWIQVKRLVGWQHPSEITPTFQISIADAAWASGLIDGEGCFRLQHPSPNSPSRSFSPIFCLSLRKDDKPCLDELSRIIGANLLYHIDNRIGQGPNAMPAYKIYIRDIPTLAYKLIPLLELAPLRSKKLREFKLFKRAVELLLAKSMSSRSNQKYTDAERETLTNISLALSELKKYESDEQAILEQFHLS